MVIKQYSLPCSNSIEDLTKEFATFFQSKIRNIRFSIDDIVARENIEEFKHKYENVSVDWFRNFRELSEDDLRELVSKSSTKHCLLDPVATASFKQCQSVLLPVITRIINLPLRLGHFPESWKCSVVKPLIKKVGLELVLKNFRPVSNLNYISKLVESAAISQYVAHLNKNGQMPKKNAAYSKHQSTETILLRVHSDILNNIDQKKVTLLVMLDLSAAFDTLDMDILSNIFKSKFKIEGNVAIWFSEYLTNRHQRIHINGVLSDKFQVEYGVPQGSVAGPVTFLSYLSSPYELIETYLPDVGGFADDNQLYLAFQPTQQGESDVLEETSTCIAAIRKWMLQHRLKINDGKTEVLFLGSKHQLNKVGLDTFTVGNTTVNVVDKVRNLGVIFDRELKMKEHISAVCSKGFHQLYRLRQIRRYLDNDTMCTLVHAFVTSHLDYGNAMFYNLPQSQICRLQHLQNAAARLILRKRKFDSARECLKELHWLPVHRVQDSSFCLQV